MIVKAFEMMRDYPLPGCMVEFGVWQGDGLVKMAALSEEYLKCQLPLYGFDSFEGFPETEVDLQDNHKIVWRAGNYADTTLDEVQKRVPSARIIKAVFSDLHPLIEYGIDRVRFARIDCDIYEGYRDSLALMTPHLQVGSLLLFDEGVAPDDPRYHDSIRDSGERAIREWQEKSGVKLKVLLSHWTECLSIVESL